MIKEEVVVLDFWSSAFAMRVKIALEEKGVEYECKEVDLFNKSSILVEMNPVHKLVPVLIHKGKPICESLIIVEYIDEVWNQTSPLLPSDFYQRSQARFWAHFIDNKIFASAKHLLWMSKGEEREELLKELIENLKILEGVLKDDKFFGGDTFGYIDVALIPITCWFSFFKKYGNFNIEANCPNLVAWTNRCKERDSVSKALPDIHKLYSWAIDLKKAHGLD